MLKSECRVPEFRNDLFFLLLPNEYWFSSLIICFLELGKWLLCIIRDTTRKTVETSP